MPADGDEVLGRSNYGGSFVSVAGRDNVFGVQFHPEKSSRNGLAMLANFVSLCRGAAG
ncbi:MAG: glutamine amidotransferase-related protein [Solirubrobacterales bacterium]